MLSITLPKKEKKKNNFRVVVVVVAAEGKENKLTIYQNFFFFHLHLLPIYSDPSSALFTRHPQGHAFCPAVVLILGAQFSVTSIAYTSMYSR